MKDLSVDHRSHAPSNGSAFAGAMGDFKQHFWLLRSVALEAGVDLGEAMREGRITALDYAKVVTQCRRAGCANACALWLSQPDRPAGQAPEFCANRPILEHLRDKTRGG